MTSLKFTCFNPSKAYLSQRESVPLLQAVGRVLAIHINLYPPGDLYLCAGEIIQASHITSLQSGLNAGEDVQGLVWKLGEPYVWVVQQDAYQIRVRDPNMLTETEIKDYVRLFREVFSNAPYNQMAYRADAWDTPLSATEVIFGRKPTRRDYVDIQTIDSFKLSQDLALYMDPVQTERVLRDRFKDPGYVGLLYETDREILRGFCFVRAVTVQRLWETEEFKWPLILSGNRDVTSDEIAFFQKMQSAFNLLPGSKVLSVSGQAIHPEVRGRDGWFGKMMAATISHVTPAHASLPGLSEISQTGASRILNAAVSTQAVSGILENGNLFSYAPFASHCLWHYEGPTQRLSSAIRQQIRRERTHV